MTEMIIVFAITAYKICMKQHFFTLKDKQKLTPQQLKCYLDHGIDFINIVTVSILNLYNQERTYEELQSLLKAQAQ